MPPSLPTLSIRVEGIVQQMQIALLEHTAEITRTLETSIQALDLRAIVQAEVNTHAATIVRNAVKKAMEDAINDVVRRHIYRGLDYDPKLRKAIQAKIAEAIRRNNV